MPALRCGPDEWIGTAIRYLHHRAPGGTGRHGVSPHVRRGADGVDCGSPSRTAGRAWKAPAPRHDPAHRRERATQHTVRATAGPSPATRARTVSTTDPHLGAETLPSPNASTATAARGPDPPTDERDASTRHPPPPTPPGHPLLPEKRLRTCGARRVYPAPDAACDHSPRPGATHLEAVSARRRRSSTPPSPLGPWYHPFPPGWTSMQHTTPPCAEHPVVDAVRGGRVSGRSGMASHHLLGVVVPAPVGVPRAPRLRDHLGAGAVGPRRFTVANRTSARVRPGCAPPGSHESVRHLRASRRTPLSEVW